MSLLLSRCSRGSGTGRGKGKSWGLLFLIFQQVYELDMLLKRHVEAVMVKAHGFSRVCSV